MLARFLDSERVGPGVLGARLREWQRRELLEPSGALDRPTVARMIRNVHWRGDLGVCLACMCGVGVCECGAAKP